MSKRFQTKINEPTAFNPPSMRSGQQTSSSAKRSAKATPARQSADTHQRGSEKRSERSETAAQEPQGTYSTHDHSKEQPPSTAASQHHEKSLHERPAIDLPASADDGELIDLHDPFYADFNPDDETLLTQVRTRALRERFEE
jgi:hypothetical protein